jgi:mannitol/fructose-specific phosphotransferase system IIA component (Ntr-type)
VYSALIKFLGQELEASGELESDADFLEALRRRQSMFQRRLDYWSRHRDTGS